MSELDLDLARLVQASKTWNDEVTRILAEGRDAVAPLLLSQIQFGIFQIPYDQYTETARYIQDRLREGVYEAATMGDSLYEAAAKYRETDDINERKITRLEY
ncbi:hypothetical protein ACFWU5_28295 [Nocardia sp. NPDC058640]|uniref:hypothetical protein n=1 Tax=Nocardia sp. NPDC058640 TaxID=3346571 RepID=UPI00364CDB64